MVDILTGKSPGKVDELFSTYKELIEQQEGIEERLRKAEEEKGSVSERIYEKVIRGYRENLEAVRSKLSPIQVEIDDFKREAERELDELEPEIDAANDGLVEAGFRYRVGEYDNDRYEEMKTRTESELEKLSARRSEIISRMEALGLVNVTIGDAQDDQEGQRRSTWTEFSMQPEGPAGEDESKRVNGNSKHQPPTDSEAEVEKTDANQCEDPQQWIDEMGSVKNAAEQRSDPHKGDIFMSDEDPLSALADPSNESPPTQSRPRESEGSVKTAVGYPTLVIDSGPNAGKKIPLLPMTMSIGREHDNNIELKDPDVARYHARIFYERGEFLLEDLESSTGTWLNGSNVKKTMLKQGDKIRFGSTDLSVEVE